MGRRGHDILLILWDAIEIGLWLVIIFEILSGKGLR